MQVLIVNTRHFPGGGDSTYSFNLASLLKNKGHQVAFFAMKDERNVPDPHSDLFVSHIDFKELNTKKNPLTGLRVLGRVIYSRKARHNFRQLIDRFSPDIVHIQNIHAHITPSIIYEAKQKRLPVVWTLHDHKQICPNSHFIIDKTAEICEACKKRSYYQAILKRCKKGSILASSMVAVEAYAHRMMRIREKVDKFISPSLFLRNKLIERGFPPEKVKHLPFFIPETSFHNHSQTGEYLLFLGKLEPIKGIYPLFEACRRAPEVRVILAGLVDESLASQLSDLLPANASYVGMKHGDELKSLLGKAQAVVLPSLCYENQPFTILEAFARGKPVIVSALGGMIELVKDRERGLLLPAGNVNALAEAMQWIVSHETKAKEMGKAAFDYAWSSHKPEKHYQRLMNLYGSLLESKPH